MENTAESYGFKAEIQQLLHILAHSLYKDRDIFLRELVSNASDALTRMQFELLTNADVLDPAVEAAIHVESHATEDQSPRLVIKDSGIGMTHDEIVQNLGTIAQSGARDFIARLSTGEVEAGEVIGRFGVGFYAVFMVADEVRVVSKSYLRDEAAVAWFSDGSDSFRVEAADKPDRGTEIHLRLREDALEFANVWRLKQIVKKYSDYVRFPIYVGGEQANRRESLWRRPPAEVNAEEYNDFYRQFTMDFEEPALTIHFSSDAPVQVRSLLFVPRHRERGVLSARKEAGVMLYSQNVLIQEYCTELLPVWLSFVDGVVDSEDLPLNVSREAVQSNRVMQQLGRSLKARVLRDLRKLGESDAEQYDRFYEEYGQILREGVAVDPEAKDDVMPLLRYRSSRSDGQWLSLESYLERMLPTQDAIYFVIGESLQAAERSPHLDPFRARSLEVLYWHEPIDIFLAPMMDQFRDKKFRNIAEEGLELPPLDKSGDESVAESMTSEADFNRFVGRCVTTLGDRISEVRPSRVLKDNPVRLLAPDGMDADRQRILRMMGRDFEVPKHILEVNRGHPLIIRLSTLVSTAPESQLIPLAIEQLYAGALVQEGLHPNPGDMLPRVQEIMQLALDALTNEVNES